MADKQDSLRSEVVDEVVEEYEDQLLVTPYYLQDLQWDVAGCWALVVVFIFFFWAFVFVLIRWLVTHEISGQLPSF